LPSSVLSDKCPYSIVFGQDPTLSHLRTFGCLCYATILNNHDKFESSPDDEGRVSSGVTNHHDSSVDDSDDVFSNTSMDEETHLEGNFGSFLSDEDPDTHDVSQLEINPDRDSTASPQTLPEQTVKRSSRPSKLPSSLNDFVVEGKVKYGLEKIVDSMNKEIEALNRNHTWDITDLPLGHSFVALLVYVDDIVVTGNDISEINKFKDLLSSTFNIRDLGKLMFFLGIEVIETDKELVLTQRKYCIELLHEFGLSACKPIFVPMPPNFVLPFKHTDEDPFLENITGYQQLIGKLIYLTHTRADIAYSVYCLAQHKHSPLKSHVVSALDVLRYLRGSTSKGLRYSYDSHFAKNKPLCPNHLLRPNIDQWPQPLVKSFGSKKNLKDLGVEPLLHVTLHRDNKVAIQLANNPVFHERSKHFELDVHFIREKIAKDKISNNLNFVHSASALWKELKEHYSQLDSHIIYQLTNEITQLKQTNYSIEMYYQKLKGLWDEADALEAPYMCTRNNTCANGRLNGAREGINRLLQFLMGLNECFSNIRGQILLMQPMPSATKAYAMLRQGEKQREGTTP
ncbi:ribonuclease H-like domain-containing protein, partial [Tanacetum coccineum]